MAGEAVIFCGSGGSEPPDRVRVDFPHFAALVTERSQIVIGDGVPRLAVEGVADGEVVTRVLSPGPLSARKGVNVTYARPELPAITEKDLADLELAAELDADFVALSFVRTADDIEQLRGAHGRADLPGARGGEDREGRGLRAARRDHRRLRRHHGRARRLRRRGRASRTCR